jgi:hypothetical protein
LQNRAFKRPVHLLADGGLRGSSSSFAHQTSLVRTPVATMRSAMESSSPYHVEDDEEDDEGISHYDSRSPSRDRSRRSKRPRNSQGDDSQRRRGTRASARHGAEQFDMVSPDMRVGPSAQSSRAVRNLIPPNASSSSAVSFNPSTPAAPARDSGRPLFTGSTTRLGFSVTRLEFPDTPEDSYGYVQRLPRYLQSGLSSPTPPTYGFSSPAHPSVSKQLGLAALPGPGVCNAVGRAPESGEEEDADM